MPLDLFTQYHNALMATPEGARASVDHLQAQAVGYVWGWQDASPTPRDTDVSVDFGYAYGIVAALYAQGSLGMRPNIADAWTSYREHGEIRDRMTGRPYGTAVAS